jgi:hypothetical protein
MCCVFLDPLFLVTLQPSIHHCHSRLYCCCFFSIVLLLLLSLCYMCHGEVLRPPITLCKGWNSNAIKNKEIYIYIYISIFRLLSFFSFSFVLYFTFYFIFQEVFFGCLITTLLFFLQELSKKLNINKNIFIFYFHMLTKKIE